MKAFILFLFWLECLIQQVHAQCCMKFEESVCVECPAGSHLYRGSCIFDVPNCLEYESGFDCAQCEEGYSLNQLNRTCTKTSDGDDPNILPNTEYMPVHSSERNSTAFVDLERMARDLFSDMSIIQLFRVFSRRQDGNRIYRLIFATDLGFLQTVILVGTNGELRILDLTQKFEKAPDEEFIDLFSDPYFPSVQEYIEEKMKQMNTSYEIIDGFRKVSSNQDELLYRVFVLSTNSGLREFNVSISIQKNGNATQQTEILPLETLDPMLDHILNTLFKQQSEFKIRNATLRKVQRIIDQNSETKYLATYEEPVLGNISVQFRINLENNQIFIINYTKANCSSVLIPTSKEPTNKMIAQITFKDVKIDSVFDLNSIIPQKYFQAIKDFRSTFYPETMNGNMQKVLVAQNQSVLIYEIEYHILSEDETVYLMQFVINNKECEQLLQLNEIYSYRKNQIISETFPPEASIDEIKQTLQKIEPSLPFILLILNMTERENIKNGNLSEVQYLEVSSTNKRFSFVYNYSETVLPDISQLIFRLKKEGNTTTVRPIGTVEVPRQMFVEDKNPSTKEGLSFYTPQVEADFRRLSNQDFDVFMLNRVLVSQQNPAKYRLVYLVDKKELVTYEIDTSAKLQLILVKREPYTDPNDVESSLETNSTLQVISNSELEQNSTLKMLKRFIEETFANDISMKNMVFRAIYRTQNEGTEETGESFLLEFFNFNTGESLLVDIFISDLTSEISILNSRFVGGPNQPVENNQTSENNETISENNTEENPEANTTEEIIDNQNQNITETEETGTDNGTQRNETENGEENNQTNDTLENKENETETQTNNTEGSNNSSEVEIGENKTQEVEEEEKNIEELASDVVYRFPDQAHTYRDLTNIDLSQNDSIRDNVLGISINEFSFSVKNKEGITYNISQVIENEELKITTEFLNQLLATGESASRDQQAAIIAISTWLRVPAIDLKQTGRVEVLKKEKYAEDITRFTVSFFTQGMKINRFVFEVETSFPGWKSIPIKAYYEGQEINNQFYDSASNYGEILPASEAAIQIVRLALGNKVNVKTQRSTVGRSPSITMIDLRHYQYGRMRIFVNNLSGGKEEIPQTLPSTKPKNEVIGIFNRDFGHFKTYSVKKLFPSTSPIYSLESITDKIFEEVKFQIEAQMFQNFLLSQQFPQLQLICAKQKNFQHQIRKIQFYYQKKISADTNMQEQSFLLLIEVLVDVSSSLSTKITRVQKFPNNLLNLWNKIEESRRSLQEAIMSELTYKISYQKLMKTYGYYLVGFDVFKVQASEKDSQMFYKIILINNKTHALLEAIVAYDYSTELSRVLSLSNYNKNQLETIIDSEIEGCKNEKINGQCVTCQSGYALNLDGNCYKRLKGCELQSGEVCINCAAGFVGASRNQGPDQECF